MDINFTKSEDHIKHVKETFNIFLQDLKSLKNQSVFYKVVYILSNVSNESINYIHDDFFRGFNGNLQDALSHGFWKFLNNNTNLSSFGTKENVEFTKKLRLLSTILEEKGIFLSCDDENSEQNQNRYNILRNLSTLTGKAASLFSLCSKEQAAEVIHKNPLMVDYLYEPGGLYETTMVKKYDNVFPFNNKVQDGGRKLKKKSSMRKKKVKKVKKSKLFN